MDDAIFISSLAARQAREWLDELEDDDAEWPEIRRALTIYRALLVGDANRYCHRLENHMLRETPTLAQALAARDGARAHLAEMHAADDASITATGFSHHSDAERVEAACAEALAEEVYYIVDLLGREDKHKRVRVSNVCVVERSKRGDYRHRQRDAKAAQLSAPFKW